MAIKINSRVTMNVTGHSEDHVRNQVMAHFGISEPTPVIGEIKTGKLNLVKMLRNFEKKFYGKPEYGNVETGLLDLKRFVEDYFHIS